MRVQTVGEALDEISVRIRQQSQKEQRMREAIDWLKRTGSVHEYGHFKFGSDRDEQHGRVRVELRRLFCHPFVNKWLIPALGDAIPSEVKDKVEMVAGPPTLGTLIARDMADHFNSMRTDHQSSVEALFLHRDPEQVYAIAECDRERLHLRDAANAIVRPRSILLVDDVRHRGHTFQACIQAIRELGGKVIATAELIDRNEHVLPIDIPNFYV